MRQKVVISPEIAKAVEIYYFKYLVHSLLGEPKVSGVYSLSAEDKGREGVERWWPDYWPNSDSPGVYFIFDQGMKLLYIGKANVLGQRLGQHFKYKDGVKSPCHIIEEWKNAPRFVVTVALKEPYEAASMEEFLISVLNPSENTIGKKKQNESA